MNTNIEIVPTKSVEQLEKEIALLDAEIAVSLAQLALCDAIRKHLDLKIQELGNN